MENSEAEIRHEISAFRKFLTDKDNRKTIVLIIAAVLFLVVLQTVKESLSGTRYIVSGGDVAGVMREDVNKAASFPLRIEADKDGKKHKKNVTLTIMADDKKSKDKDEPGENNKETLFEAELSELISKLSDQGGKKIMLPASLDDGTKLKWKKGQNGTELMLLLLAPLFIWLVYVDGERKKREVKKEKRESVIRNLPAFSDELLLLLGSGLIFRDAFGRIACGYQKRDNRSYFEQKVIGIWDETEKGVSDLVNVISRTADDMGISEFSRLVSVIRDNQLRGVDVSDKLKNESEILWDLRKKNAEERGRLAETKMTMPLAVLLIVLVLVTAAPAIIQVEGG